MSQIGVRTVAARITQYRAAHEGDPDGRNGIVGSRLVDALKPRGDEVTVLSRDAARARQRLGVNAVAWDWRVGPAPAAALSGRDVVVHLAGEPVAQRGNATVKDRIRDSREHGTRQLVAGLQSADPRPPRLVCASACAYYGAHGEDIIDETSPAGSDWLADVCVRWEREADAAAMLGASVVTVRTGITLDAGRPPVPTADSPRRPDRHVPVRH